MNAALDVIDTAMQQYAAGFAGAASAAQADPETAALIANAVQEGLSVRTGAQNPVAQGADVVPATAAMAGGVAASAVGNLPVAQEAPSVQGLETRGLVLPSVEGVPAQGAVMAPETVYDAVRGQTARPVQEGEAQALILPSPEGWNNAAPESGTAVNKKSATIVEHLRNNAMTLMQMEPVATVTGNELPKQGNATERAMAFLKSIGNKVTRSGLGEVLFSRSKLKTSLVGHGGGTAKLETIAAVPAVIKDGAIINHIQNYEGRGYDTYLIGAPVDYRGRTVLVGAVITKDKITGRYYVHEVVDANGNILLSEKEPEGNADNSPTRDEVVIPSGSERYPQSSAVTAGYPTVSETSETPLELLGAADDRVPQPGRTVNSGPETFSDAVGAQMGGETPQNIVNGGITNERGTGAFAAVAGGNGQQQAGETARSDSFDGGQGRLYGQRTGEQAAGTRGGAKLRELAGQAQTALDRRHRTQGISLRELSGKDLGIASATDRRTVRVLPEDLYDEEIRRMDERVFSLTGIRPSFVMGGIEIQTKGGGIEHARGAYTGDQIIIQADHSRLSVTQIAEHELWHALADHAGSMNEAAWEKIVAR